MRPTVKKKEQTKRTKTQKSQGSITGPSYRGDGQDREIMYLKKQTSVCSQGKHPSHTPQPLRLVLLEVDFRTSCELGKHSVTELHPKSQETFTPFLRKGLMYLRLALSSL